MGVAVGVTGKDIPKGQWSEVELPDAKVKIASVAVDNTGSFCLVVSDKGVVYFGGMNKKGEAGENGKLPLWHVTMTMGIILKQGWVKLVVILAILANRYL